MPTHFSDFGRGAYGNDGKSETVLSDVASDAEKSIGHLSDLEVIGGDAGASASATVCPWCGQPVDKMLLDDFSWGKRMNVRLQTRFCRQHKKQTAMETWRAKNYPEVDWEGMDRRFAAHRSFLLGIINGNASHFRSILAQKIKSGQARSMKKEGDMNPGYYGPRGFDLMCDYLVDEFGELLKEKAVDDRVIAGRGSAAFIQTVLVAELAVQLIKDDMGVSAEEARSIMEESKALGEMVHEGT
ncbi:RTC4-like domain-containing protein [Hirsutella rhossiliensis]|uniref:Restriction of telomere capping protein 4 n=1 Tax=Hirsutella rhossiliensis TaxID=111463 RepID=A0A9P8SCY5_9HYPO|nr:RTC4-like domain-containing protein [Hirsutella rhossiliensis]KAH0957379.1 RTC4-like domain-containing protein [Hirsutella rhossiliensis]